MSIVVLGKSGQVATALRTQREVTALGRDQADLNDPEAVVTALEAAAPSVIINAAAYTAVDQAESDADAAFRLNAEAPGQIAEWAAARDIPFLHISTDYVFNGSGEKPWSPNDPIAPLSVYGRSKAKGEARITAANGPHAILRTSWVFSETGANFVRTMLRLGKQRDALTIVSDQIGGPTSADDIAAALLKMADALLEGRGASGIYHFAGAPDVSWADFAREIFAQANLSVTVTDIPTSDYPTPAARPLNSRLNCDDLARDYGIERPNWQRSLADVLAKLEG
ncbi:dTDP-4-dehydrorhamnose reductase [Paracoccaceae bacterium GXU_MW_L88]